MNITMEKLKDHLKLFPKDGDDFQSILDVLFYYFILEHAVDTAVIRANFRDIGDILEKLSFEDNNTLFCAIVRLCEEHSKQGFMEGVRIGAVLLEELKIPPVVSG